MMRRRPALAFLIVFEHGKIRDPEKLELAALEQAVPLGILLREGHSQETRRRIHRAVVLLHFGLHAAFGFVFPGLAVAGNNHNQVIGLGPGLFANLGRCLRK